MILPYETDGEAAEELPLLRDIAVDRDTLTAKRSGGRIMELFGREALENWIWKALATKKDVFCAYGDEFGMDTDAAAAGSEEAYEAVREALLVSEYIEDITDFLYERDGSAARISFTAVTVYGDIEAGEEYYD